MKPIFQAMTLIATFFLAGCGFFGDVEEVGEPQPGHTVYRAPGGSDAGDAVATPAPQKVPGE